MPSVITARPWTQQVKPPFGSFVNKQHPLCPTLGFLFNEGGGKVVHAIGKGPLAGQAFAVTGTPTWTFDETGAANIDLPSGVYIELPEIMDVLSDRRVGSLISRFIDQKTTSARGVLGDTNAPPNRTWWAPTYSSTAYFDWGKNGPGRISWTTAPITQTPSGGWYGTFAGIARQDDIEAWYNGTLKTSKGSGNTRPDQTGDVLRIGAHGTTDNDFSPEYFYFYDGIDLLPAQIQELTENPFVFIEERRYWSFGAGAGAVLEGDLSYSLTNTGELQIGKQLAGDLAYSLAHTGDISIGQFLAGDLAYSLTHAGTIEIGKFLAGDLSYSLTHAGTIEIGKFLAGDLSYSLTEVGDIQIGKFLAGALSYSLTEAGTIQVGKFLAGALAYSLTHAGTLTVGGIELAGDLVYSLTHGGTIQIGKFLAGALAYSLTHTGDLQIGKFLAGALVYSLTHQGTLEVGTLLSGDLDYSLTELGDIQIGQFLAGALSYSLTEVGAIEIGKFLQGALTYSLTEAGTLTLDILLSGALNYSLAHTGNLQIGQFLNGNLTYSLTETGDIQIGINLVGQETITLTLAGTLTVAAVVFRVLLRINEALQTPNMTSESLSVTQLVDEILTA